METKKKTINKRLSKKEQGFVKDIRDKIKKLSPQQIRLRNLYVDSIIRKSEIEQWTTKEEDFWRFVYVMKCNEFYKIGIAIKLDDRLNQVQTGNPYVVSLVFGIKHKKAEEIEKELHKIFIQKRHKREWFILNEEDLIFIREYIGKYET